MDFAPPAIAKARAKADDAGVEVKFVIDDFTKLEKVNGPFDFLVDYGSFDDLNAKHRAAYVRKVVPLGPARWKAASPVPSTSRRSPAAPTVRRGRAAGRPT